MSRLVIIHDTDADGICAAWCISRGFLEVEDWNNPDKCLFIPQRAGNNIPPLEDLKPSDTVYMVDRTYPVETMLDVANRVSFLHVLDHHKSALEDISNYFTENPEACKHILVCPSSVKVETFNARLIIDTQLSACGLALDYAYAYSCATRHNKSFCNNLPWFVEYVQDRDLWQWKLPMSRELNTAIYCSDPSIELFDKLHVDQAFVKPTMGSLIMVGEGALTLQNKLVKSIAESNIINFFHTSSITQNTSLELVAMLPCPFSLISEVGAYLLNQDTDRGVKPTVVICYNEMFELEEFHNRPISSSQQGYMYSMRSAISTVDFAKGMGGGGHPNACGFTSSISPNSLATNMANTQEIKSFYPIHKSPYVI